METQKILNADYIDILYDNRNKQYGSYDLRKNYNRRLYKGLASMFGIVGTLACLSFISMGNNAPTRNHTNRPDTLMAVAIQHVLPPKLPPATPVSPRVHVKTVALLTPVVAPDHTVTDPKPDPKPGNAQPGANTDTTGSDNANTVNTNTAGTGTETVQHIKPDPVKPVIYADEMPLFNGDMAQYLSANIRYPDAAREANIDGRVVVNFVVSADGSISDAKIIRAIGGGCDEEALRVVRNMPHWKPGKMNGKPVAVYFTLPLVFKLQ